MMVNASINGPKNPQKKKRTKTGLAEENIAQDPEGLNVARQTSVSRSPGKHGEIADSDVWIYGIYGISDGIYGISESLVCDF